jgi:hypothetical protein
MKTLKLLSFAFIAIFISCSSMQKKSATDKVKSFIAGTYVRAFEGEYSIGNDTLVIEQPDANNNYYTIQHKMSYQQIKDKKPLPLEYKTENWTAIFNEQTNVLEEQKKGKQLSFSSEENTLLLGGSKFKKIS